MQLPGIIPSEGEGEETPRSSALGRESTWKCSSKGEDALVSGVG